MEYNFSTKCAICVWCLMMLAMTHVDGLTQESPQDKYVGMKIDAVRAMIHGETEDFEVGVENDGKLFEEPDWKPKGLFQLWVYFGDCIIVRLINSLPSVVGLVKAYDMDLQFSYSRAGTVIAADPIVDKLAVLNPVVDMAQLETPRPYSPDIYDRWDKWRNPKGIPNVKAQQAPGRTFVPPAIQAKMRAGFSPGDDVNAFDEDGKTLLAYAVKYGDEKLAAALIAAGADVNHVDEDGAGALFYARNEKVARLCLDAGAGVNRVDDAGNGALHCARNEEMARLYLGAGANVNQKNKFGRTPLHCACRKGMCPLARFLVQNGADVNAVDNESAKTPLHHVAERTFVPIEMAMILLQNGADVNLKAKFGKTPLHCAARYNRNPLMASFLLASGADRDAVDDFGKKPIESVKYNKNAPSVMYMFTHDFDIKGLLNSALAEEK